jgi:hypothetical protein
MGAASIAIAIASARVFECRKGEDGGGAGGRVLILLLMNHQDECFSTHPQ